MTNIAYKIIVGRCSGSRNISLWTPKDYTDGFIHLSSPALLSNTLNKFGNTDLTLVCIDLDIVSKDMLKWEYAKDGNIYPHMYGDINTDSILWIKYIITCL